MKDCIGIRGVFQGKNVDKFRFTNHFHERWNERMEKKFEKKEDLENFIKANYTIEDISHVNGDYYMVDNLMMTCVLDEKLGNVLFITTYGKKEDNPILYNVLITEGAKGIKAIQGKYGKMNLQKFS